MLILITLVGSIESALLAQDEASAEDPIPEPVEQTAEEAAKDAFRAVVNGMDVAISQMQSATWRFHKQEYVDGEWLPEEIIDVRYRPPEDLYMHWVGDVHEGRELMFRPGWNDDEIRVSTGPFVPTLNLNPLGSIAMRGERHSIHHLAITSVVGNFLRDRATLEAHPELKTGAVDRGIETIYGEPARCFDLTLPKDQDPSLYAYEVDFCVHLRTGLPAHALSFSIENGAFRQVELYGYENMRINPGLTDADFDPENPEYGF